MNEIMFPKAPSRCVLHGITMSQMAQTVTRVHSRLDRNNEFSESFDETIIMNGFKIHILDWVADGVVMPMLFELDPNRVIRVLEIVKPSFVQYCDEGFPHYQQVKRFNCLLYLCMSGDLEMNRGKK